MAGMCRYTGKRLEGWLHIKQSLTVLFTTRFNTRLERRSFGSDVPALQDKPATPETILDHYASIATAIDAFEPRVSLQGFRLLTADENGDARIAVDIADRVTGDFDTLEVAV